MFSVTPSSAEAGGCINIEIENGENARFAFCLRKVDSVLCLYSLLTMESNENPKCDSLGMQRSFPSPSPSPEAGGTPQKGKSLQFGAGFLLTVTKV